MSESITVTQGRTKKRARLTVGEDETTQVTSLDDRYRLPLADADAYYVPDFIDEATAQEWHDELLKLDQCELASGTSLALFAESVLYSSCCGCNACRVPPDAQGLRQRCDAVAQDRRRVEMAPDVALQLLLISPPLVPAFSTEPELEVKYSGHPVRMHHEYPPLLRKIQDMVEEKLGVKFNHAFLNLYEDGKIYIGNHRDNRENRCVSSSIVWSSPALTAHLQGYCLALARRASHVRPHARLAVV